MKKYIVTERQLEYVFQMGYAGAEGDVAEFIGLKTIEPLTDEQIENLAGESFVNLQDTPDDKVDAHTFELLLSRAIERHIVGEAV